MTDSPSTFKEGYAIFKHPSLPANKEYRTWYRVVGNISSSRPLVLLHGGPGAGHKRQVSCFDTYAAQTETPIVYYDQIGCGNSTHIPEKKGDEMFWTPALFVAELDNLLRHLGIRNNFDLYGHSWGSKLAARYAVSEQQKGSGLHKIILSSGTAVQKDLIQTVKNYIAGLPQETQDLIHRCIVEGREDEHDYQLALWEFFKKQISQNIPRPNTGDSVMAPFVADDVVYSTMLGKDPFHVEQGSLRTFDMTEECKQIRRPVLLLTGEFEDARQAQPFFDGIPKVKWFVFPGSAHSAASDQPEKYRSVVWNFLKS